MVKERFGFFRKGKERQEQSYDVIMVSCDFFTVK
jgi:hypothetical protein